MTGSAPPHQALEHGHQDPASTQAKPSGYLPPHMRRPDNWPPATPSPLENECVPPQTRRTTGSDAPSRKPKEDYVPPHRRRTESSIGAPSTQQNKDYVLPHMRLPENGPVAKAGLPKNDYILPHMRRPENGTDGNPSQPKKDYVLPHMRRPENGSEATIGLPKKDYVLPHMRRPENGSDPPSAQLKKDDVLPHLRRPENSTDAISTQIQPQLKRDHIPPHMRQSQHGNSTMSNQPKKVYAASPLGPSVNGPSGNGPGVTSSQPAKAPFTAGLNSQPVSASNGATKESRRRRPDKSNARGFHKKQRVESLASSPPKRRRSRWPTKSETREYLRQGELEWEAREKLPREPSPVYDLNSPANLLDWDGLLAPPIDWSNRDPCIRDRWVDVMKEFCERSASLHLRSTGDGPSDFQSNIIIDMDSIHFLSPNSSLEVAPREWLDDEDAREKQFQDCLSQEPEPEDLEDFDPVPYWKRYVDKDSPFLQEPPHPHPTMCRLEQPSRKDRSTEGHEARALWQKSRSQCSDSQATRLREKFARETEEKECLERDRERYEKDQVSREPVRVIAALPNPNAPQARIYLRAAKLANDVGKISLIYTHYVRNTCYTDELVAPDAIELRRRFEVTTKFGLPVIVAVERKSELKKMGRLSALNKKPADKIVGFAFAEGNEPAGRHGANSYVADLQIYVDPRYQAKGIGKSLLDRMLLLMDPFHHSVVPVRWKVKPFEEEDRNAPLPRQHLVKIIRVHVHYPEEERARLDWIEVWLMKFGFQMKADWSNAGVKMKKWTREAGFEYITGEGIEPPTDIRVIPGLCE